MLLQINFESRRKSNCKAAKNKIFNGFLLEYVKNKFDLFNKNPLEAIHILIEERYDIRFDTQQH